jgi:hypothetical protein
MKNLLRVVALFVVVVLVASGCSYSEEAEPGVRNLALVTKAKSVKPTFSSDCERDLWSRPASFGCYTVSEQQRAAVLLNSVRFLVQFDPTVSYLDPYTDRTKFLKFLIDFEALEVLCYMPVHDWMVEEGLWPVAPAEVPPLFWPGLVDQLDLTQRSIDFWLSEDPSTPTHTAEAPVLETVRYRHLCPSWMYE